MYTEYMRYLIMNVWQRKEKLEQGRSGADGVRIRTVSLHWPGASRESKERWK